MRLQTFIGLFPACPKSLPLRVCGYAHYFVHFGVQIRENITFALPLATRTSGLLRRRCHVQNACQTAHTENTLLMHACTCCAAILWHGERCMTFPESLLAHDLKGLALCQILTGRKCQFVCMHIMCRHNEQRVMREEREGRARRDYTGSPKLLRAIGNSSSTKTFVLSRQKCSVRA
jgi:hypothetical protein